MYNFQSNKQGFIRPLYIIVGMILILAGVMVVISLTGSKNFNSDNYNPPYVKIETKNLILGQVLAQEKSIIEVAENEVGMGLGVKRLVETNKTEQEILVMPVFDGANTDAEMAREDNKILYKNVFPFVDVEYVIFDGHIKENIILKDETAQREFSFSLKKFYPELVNIDFRADSGGSYLTLVDNNTGEELLTLDYPIGYDAKGFPIPYHYRLKGDTVILEAHDMRDWSKVKFPVVVDPPMTIREYDEALVVIGQDGEADDTKDGDVITVKPKGWHWGKMEYRDFLIVRVPKMTEEQRMYYQKVMTIPLEDHDPEISTVDPVYDVLDKIKGSYFWGIDYQNLVSNQQARLIQINIDGSEQEIEKVNFMEILEDYDKDNPILDLSELTVEEIFQKKNWVAQLEKVKDLKKFRQKDDWLKQNNISLVDHSVVPQERKLIFRPRDKAEEKNWLAKWWNKLIKPARAATNTSKVGTGSCDSSCDYSLLSDWETAKDGDITDNGGDIEQAECYNDGVMGDDFYLSGWETNSSYYVRVYTPASERHNGTAATGFRIYSTDSNDVIDYAIDGIRIEGLIIDNAYYSGSGSIFGMRDNGPAEGTDDGADRQFSHNVIYQSYNGSPGGYGMFIINGHSDITPQNIGRAWNNICYGYVDSGCVYLEDDGMVAIYNNTFVGGSDSGVILNSYLLGGDYHTIVKNNVVIDGSDPFGGEAADYNTTYSTNNVSDIGDAPGNNPINGEPTFVDKDGKNFHLDSTDSVAIEAGADLSSDATTTITIDIDDEARDGTNPDVGADEYTPPASSTSIPGVKLEGGSIKVEGGSMIINQAIVPKRVVEIEPEEEEKKKNI